MTALTQEKLQELLSYNPETGVFTRKVDSGRHNRWKAGTVTGTVDVHGYVLASCGGRQYKAHRLAFLYMTGDIPKEVDHINGVRDDNRWVNLRGVGRQENSRNQKKRVNNKSGVMGVYQEAKSGTWYSQITVDGVTKHLGRFKEKGDAIEARLAAVAAAGFHENHDREMI